MKIAGIIAEYNPLHSGHVLLMKKLRENGAESIAVVMSGNFVQRGSAAILSKYARAREALACGADLVIELPLPWAVSGAEHFALGGVSLLTALGADTIAFGSECGEVKALRKAQAALSSPQLHNAIAKSLQNGITFAAARQKAVCSLFGNETAELLGKPNNILGIEYLKAVETLHSPLEPFTIKREGNAHNSCSVFAGNASSAAVRKKILSGDDFSGFMPKEAYDIVQEEIRCGHAPASFASLELAVPAVLRRMEKNDFSHLPDLSEGLENRIYNAVQNSGSLTEILRQAKSKRYPLARIRRIVLSAFLGIDASLAAGLPPYLHILGIGKNGAKILRAAKEKNMLPIFSRYADRSLLGEHSQRVFDLEDRSSDLYALCLPKPAPCGLDRSRKMIVL